MKKLNSVLLVATMDTKSEEALFLKARMEELGVSVVIMDAGIKGKSPVRTSISREQVAKAHGKTIEEVQAIGHEGEALDVMINGAIQCALDLYAKDKIGGIIGLGGSMGTTLGTAVMRSFPFGFPKVMISTMASRDTRSFVGTKDITMLHSVCDISGLNRITKQILSNGGAAIAGMVRHMTQFDTLEKPLVFLSTLGTTEACAQHMRQELESNGYEVVIFHTVGSGGKAMEEMVKGESVAAVIDMSLHEIADHFFGGDYDAGPSRGSAALQKGVPAVLVPGNIDFLVTGPLKIAKKRFPGRAYHKHNVAITAIRTDKKEIEFLAQVLADLCNSARGQFSVLVPMGGFSAFDSEEGPLHDPEAPELFVETFKKSLEQQSSMNLLPHHINDPEFAQAVIQALEKLLEI